MKKVLILGVNGYLGSHLAWFLNKNGYIVSGAGRRTKPIKEIESLLSAYTSVDLSKKETLHALDWNVTLIFFAAGKSGVLNGFQEYDSFISDNEISLLNVLDVIVSSKSQGKLIFPSSRLVYKGKPNVFLTEEDEKATLSVYAINKIASEHYIQLYHSVFNIQFLIFRICVPYGNLLGDTFSYGTIRMMLNFARNKEPITLYGDGSQKRTLTHIEDIVTVIKQASEHPDCTNSIFNIGGPDNCSLFDIASCINDKFKTGIQFQPWPELALKMESGDTLFDGSKLELLTESTYRYSFREWVKGINC